VGSFVVAPDSKSVGQVDESDGRSTEGVNWGALIPGARLGDQLSQRMAALIESGEFSEGGRLPPESELADRFGVSRPVIREALSQLRVMGVIVSRRGSGSYVQRRVDVPTRTITTAVGFGPVSSLAQVRQCHDFRISVEGDAACYAALNRTPEMLVEMRSALDRMEAAIEQGSVGMTPDFELHLSIARASCNEFYIAVLESMRTPIEFAINLARSLALTHPHDHLFTVQAEHVAMFEAIKAQDKDAARLAMQTHIRNARSRVFDGPGSGVERLRSMDGSDPV
jgi:DNA-binding FadR family transcriptional regulator